MRGRLRHLLLLAWLALGLSVPATLQAQPAGQVRGEFKLPFFTEGRLASQLTGTSAEFLKDGSVLLKTARVEHYDPKGNSNATVVVLATNCVVTRTQVWSAEGLKVATADGQFTLTGVGFGWRHGASEFVVSNQIRTAVRKSENRAAVAPDDLLNIRADALRLNYASNVVVFTGNVRADDPTLEVTCGDLSVRRSESGRFDRIVATQEVMLQRRLDDSRVTSERAEYQFTAGGEVVELTGNPHWRDAQREAKADRFELRRPASKQDPAVMEAIGHAWLKMPAMTNNPANWSLLAAAPANTPASQPGRSIELSAGIVSLVLPPTNGPVQSVRAATNVVITDPQAGWRATAASAVFTNAVLEMTGDPQWRDGERFVGGDTFRLVTSPQSFAVNGHALVRLPVTALGGNVPGLEATRHAGAARWTNLVLNVSGDRAEFREGRLVLEAPVEAELREAGQPLGRLRCRELTLNYTGRLERVQAAGNVSVEQFPDAVRPGLSREARCEVLFLELDAASLPTRFVADGGVTGKQTERKPRREAPVVTTVQADRIEARFAAGTNRLETATAEGGVQLEQSGRRALGGRAVFTAADGLLALTGQPLVETPEGRIADTTSLTYDTRRKRFRGVGPFRVEWTKVPTNFTAMKNKFLPPK